MKTIAKLVGAGALMAMSGLANAASVGGVTWDENAPDDFAAQFNFTQWYTSGANAIDNSLNLAPNISAALQVPSQLAVGSVLTGVGEVYSINSNQTDTNFPTGGLANDFFPGGELTFVLGGLVVDTLAPVLTPLGTTYIPTFSLNNSFINIYAENSVTAATNFLTNPNSQGGVNNASQGNLWLSLSFQSLQILGTANSATLNAGLAITGGLAAGYFEPGQVLAWNFAFADATQSGSAFFDWNGTISRQGNGQFESRTSVPEPSALALLGIGMLGFGVRRRAKLLIS